MGKTGGKSRPKFLKDYQLSESFLRSPGSDGSPGIVEGYHAGNNVLVKQWPKLSKKADADLEEIWRHELRQLHRLSGYPGVGDLIASLYEAGEDSEGFYLVLEPQNRSPIEIVLRGAAPGHWLKNPRSAASRLKLWRNFERVAKGLELLHAQGILHRNLDTWSILTKGAEDLDFQLTGFEWSMRLTAPDHAASGKKGAAKSIAARFDSFGSDWKNFGLLCGHLLGAKLERLTDPQVPPSEIADYFENIEARFLRQLIGVEYVERIDGDFVAERIAEISRRLEAYIADKEAQYRLVVNLGKTSKLSEQIRTSTGDEIETGDIEAQKRFIELDLSKEALLVAVREGSGFRFAIRGHALTYRVDAYRPFGQPETWDFAQCFAADGQPPASKQVLGDPIALVPGSLKIMSSTEASAVFGRVRKRVAGWQELRERFREEDQDRSREAEWRRALALTQLLEMAFAASDVFPIKILSRLSATEQDRRFKIRVEIRSEDERDQLASVLGLKAHSERFEEALNSDSADVDGGWVLSEASGLGDRDSTDTAWRFVEVVKENGRTAFAFEGDAPSVVKSEAYFYPAASAGSIAQFKRRLRALTALGEHSELLRMIVDPRRRIFDSQDLPVSSDDHLQRLDPAKREALAEAWATVPIYLVQGPPGVGKTHLVRELVRRRFSDDPTSRLLLTAQSHAAIDHLMGEIRDVVADEEIKAKPLIVRCRKKDSTGSAGPLDVSKQAEGLLRAFSSSMLFAEGARSVRDQVLDALPKKGTHRVRSNKGNSAAKIAAFESIVLRSANIVFATSNAPELERLIEERGQFDWTVIEEAGKATGGELVSPLLLSHRRLMIGDHKQLPPYRSEEMRRVLDSTASIDQLIKTAPFLIGRILRGGGIDELLDEWEAEDLSGIGGAAIDALLMFETIIEREFKRQRLGGKGRNIARSLTVQHRMHPEIAELVSKVFYRGELETADAKKERVKSEVPPFAFIPKACISERPITLVSMPDLQSTKQMKVGDRLPRWWNPDEIDVVVSVLQQLTPRDASSRRPTLAVLAPYAEQTRRINKRIEELKGGRLRNLDGFDPATATGVFCSTVDAFQGSEADVVIVSLVRNNQHSKPSPALGFLQSFQRMNVLLSRARHKLVLVGSFDFLRSVVSALPEDPESKLWFLKELVSFLDDGVQRGVIELRRAAEVLK